MQAMSAASGWRRRGWAVLLGMAGAAALPPCYLLPLLIPSLSGLFLFTLSARNARQAFGDGWWWGLGHFTTGLYWICISLYVEPDKFAWLTPFALFGLPSIIAIYIGLVTLILYKIHKRWNLLPGTLVFTFAGLWVGAEYVRAYLFTGFPWNLLGYAWNLSDVTLQMAAVWGIYGQSWLAVTLATLPALFYLKHAQALPFNRALSFNFMGVVMLLAAVAFGALRLADHPTQYTATHLRIVQGNIAQSMKFDPKTAMQGLRKHIELTRSAGLEKVNMVIWPETAIPYSISPDSPLLHELGSMLKGGTLLFTGGMRVQGDEKDWRAWNSAFVINGNGTVVAQYDKYHLVPFGEYIPLRHVLPLENIAGGMGDFSTGPGPVTLSPTDIPPFSPLICYEAIFPDRATDGLHAATWLANITNDAWFGVSSGPYQHLEMARTRAVEQGIPLIRAANTGISAVADGYGRILKRVPLNVSGILDSPLPVFVQGFTIFSRFGNSLILLLIIVSFCLNGMYNKMFYSKII